MPRRPRYSARPQYTLALALLCAAAPAAAYNHEQHQGMVALGYKAMVAASLELGCPVLNLISGEPPTVRTFRPEFCDNDPAGCEARWSELLSDIERAIRYLRSIDSGLAPPRASC